MKNKILLIILISMPIAFFVGYHFLQLIITPDKPESLQSEIIGAIICGGVMDVGFWSLYRKTNKNQKKKTSK